VDKKEKLLQLESEKEKHKNQTIEVRRQNELYSKQKISLEKQLIKKEENFEILQSKLFNLRKG